MATGYFVKLYNWPFLELLAIRLVLIRAMQAPIIAKILQHKQQAERDGHSHVYANQQSE
jgi:hypothetical protein